MRCKKFYLLVFAIIGITFSCRFKNVGSSEEIKYSWYKWDSLTSYTDGILSDSIYSNTRVLQYLECDSSLFFRLEVRIKPDTMLLLNGEPLIEKDNKQFLINGMPVDIHKYYYGNEKYYHEDGFVFINFSIGLIGINFHHAGLSFFPERKYISEGIKDTLLQAKNRSFFE